MVYGEAIVWRLAVPEDAIKDHDEEEGNKSTFLKNSDKRFEENNEKTKPEQ